ncbi:MAG TPA: PRC-barrel domain containing protein [Bacteroidetes bacterium]|nr:PRC-barrel domain containing protein [Bacteroidota bacterium]
MPKKSNKETHASNIMAELYELTMPGELIGKEVIDASARKIGIVRNIKLTFPPARIEVIIKGLDVEFPLPMEVIANVGGVVQLKETIKQAEELEIRDVARLREEIANEIASYLR